MDFDMSKVYPWIKAVRGNKIILYPEQGRNGVEVEIGEDIPWHNFADTLGVFYVYDTGDRFAIVSGGMLPEGMTEDELYIKACENLWNDVRFRIEKATWGGYGVICGGNFEASSICSLTVLNTIAEQYKSDFYFAVPARDMMITASVDDRKQIKGFKRCIDRIMKKGEFPLSSAIFKWEYNKTGGK